MINHVSLDQFEKAIEEYEVSWTPRSRKTISAVLDRHDLSGNVSALTELIRVDIELQYEHGQSVQLDDYFGDHEELLQDNAAIAQIAFEDFRSRSSQGQRIAPERWQSLPGIKNEVWFQQILWERSSFFRKSTATSGRQSQNLVPGGEPAIEAALAGEGFRIVHEIGQGALSRVYLAQQQALAHRYVVLKVVKQALAEPHNMALLQHTNIVQIHSFHRIGSISVICMPYSGSVTLKDHLQSIRHPQDLRGSQHHDGGQGLADTVRNRVKDTETKITANAEADDPIPDLHSAIPAANENAVLKPLEQIESFDRSQLTTWLFERLASALAHSHARNVLHGDLKPANVLVRNDGEPVLLDFNLSHSLSSSQPQHVGGTLPYMSPEGYRDLMRQTITPNATSDQYSLGVMMFEFMTGRLPFPAPPSEAAIDLKPAIDARRNTKPDWQAGDMVPPGLQSIINRCLEFSPDDRYQTADDLQQDLRREHLNQPLVHAAEPKLVRAKKWVRQNPWFVRIALTAAVLAMAIPVAMQVAQLRGEQQKAVATERFHAFAEESADQLSVIMATPHLHEAHGVTRAFQPLEKFGVLNSNAFEQFRWPQITTEEETIQRNTLLRHLVHVGFAEADRLLPRFQQGSLSDEELGTLDQLIAAADRVCANDHYESRGLLFLKAQRAEYSGDHKLRTSQLKRGEALPLTSDSEKYLEAVRLATAKQWKESIALLANLPEQSVIQSNLRWTMLGRAQFNLQHLEDAKLSITKSIEGTPDASRLLYLRGRIYYGMSFYNRAKIDLAQCLELEKDLAPAWYLRGLCKLADRDIDGAISDLTEALRLNPGNAQYLLVRSRAYRRAQMRTEAERDFAAAMNAQDLDHTSYQVRAKARKERGDYEGSLADLRKADELVPNGRTTLTKIAKTLSMRLGRPQEALKVLNRVVELYPQDESAYIDRAVLLAQLGRFEEADRDMEIALPLPNKSLTYYQAACVYALKPDRSDHEQGLQMLARAILTGYDVKTSDVETDPDLKSLHKLEGFQAVITAHKLSTARLGQFRGKPLR